MLECKLFTIQERPGQHFLRLEVEVTLLAIGYPAYPLLSWLIKVFPDKGIVYSASRRHSIIG